VSEVGRLTVNGEAVPAGLPVRQGWAGLLDGGDGVGEEFIQQRRNP
jgi:hypothetical protein